MAISQPSLVQFEVVRKENKLIPPINSNSFFDIGDGKINLFTIRDDPTDYRFDLLSDKGKIYTGVGSFIIAGDIKDIDLPYNSFTVISETIVAVNQILLVKGGKIDVYGALELLPYSQLKISGGEVIIHPNSKIVINDRTNLLVEKGGSLTIYGEIDVHLSVINSVLNSPNVTIDSAAVLNVSGIDEGERIFSFTDYAHEIRKEFVNINTQREMIFATGRAGYVWRMGNPKEPSQVLGINLQIGEIPLGDFRLPILGIPDVTKPQMQTISDLTIRRDTILHVSESFHEYHYIRPELYLGIIIGNTETPAKCIVEGAIIANGINSLITIDRGAILHIKENGVVTLQNGAIMRSTHNQGHIALKIDGTLIIDDISQIESFNEENIAFGINGKVIILNPDTGEKRLLFTTPDGIQGSTLYRIFKNRIDFVEYHISKNTGIGIDKNFRFYGREMTKWYGERRIEKAIHDGILIWHDGAFIELYSHITTTIDENSSLLHAGRLFKGYGSYDDEYLQDVVNRLQYAGCGDILFRFVNGDNVGEVLLNLEGVKMKSLVYNPIVQKYILKTDNDGVLFIRNFISDNAINTLIHPRARSYSVDETHEVQFSLV